MVCSPPRVNPPQLARRSIAPTGDADRFQPFGLLVQQRILTARRGVVVGADRGLQRAGRQGRSRSSSSATVSQTHVGGRFRNGVADSRGHRLFLRIAVDDQVRRVVLVVQRELPDPAGVHVLGDIALSAPVDEDAADGLLRVDQERDLGGVHVGQVGAERLRHPDRLAVVLLDGRGRAARRFAARTGRPSRRCRRSCPRRARRRVARGWRRLAVLAGVRCRRRGRRTRRSTRCTWMSYTAFTPSGCRGVDERLHQHVAGAGLAGCFLLDICGTWPRGAGLAMVLNG